MNLKKFLFISTILFIVFSFSPIFTNFNEFSSVSKIYAVSNLNQEQLDQTASFLNSIQNIINKLKIDIQSLFGREAKAATETIGLVRQDCTGYSNCFTSLSAWEAAYGGITFGACAQGDLVCADKIAIAQIDGAWTQPDTTAVTINGWTTDATHYIKIYTTTAARHQGKWDTGKYRLELTDSNMVEIRENYVRIEGLQLQNTITAASGTYRSIFVQYIDIGGSDIRILSNIIREGSSTGLGGAQAIVYADTDAVLKIANNIIYDFLSGSGYGIFTNQSNPTIYIYNNTIYNCDTGYKVSNGMVLKNNIAQACSNGYSNNISVDSDYNISDIASDAPGTNSKNSTTVSFVDSTNKDFHLSSSDISAKDAGIDLSADANLAFTTDIDGNTRPIGSAWDIGADEEPTVSQGDTTPPVLSSGSPSGALPSGTTQTTLSVSTLDENSTCKYGTIPNTVYASIANTFTTTGGTSHSQTITGLTNGTSYNYYVRCSDASGNANTTDYTISFSVSAPTGDTTPPTVSITSPISGVTVSGTITITVNATDNTAIAGVQFKLDNSNIGAEDTTSPYSYSLNTATITDGAHTLIAVARDTSNNYATSTTITIIVNNASPSPPDTIVPSIPTNLTATPVSSSQINLSWTVSTDNIGVAGYKIYRCLGSGCTPTIQITTSPITSYSDTGLTASTTYTYAVSAYDAAGNESGKSINVSAITQSGATQTWQQTLEQNFDNVETFDDIQDWKPDNMDCPARQINKGPLRLDGTSSLFEAYNFGSNLPVSQRDWAVYGFPTDRMVGAKSLILGVEGIKPAETCWKASQNYTGHQGVSGLKGYFGEEGNQDGSSGYDEVYIFFRAYIPKNYIPTNEENLADKIFKYIEGNDYLDTSGVGAKMVNIGTGFVDTLKYHDATTNTIVDFYNCPSGYDCRYGDSETWLYMRSYKDQEGKRKNLGTTITYLNAYGNVSDKNYPYPDGWKNAIGQLGAVEIHMKLESPQYAGAGPKNGDGIIQVFVYDQYGNPMETVYGNNLVFRSNINQANHKINRIWFHGNHRTRNEAGTGDYYYGCGEGMECAWWIDDFIIDNQPIGPAYFSLLSGTAPPSDTTPPSTPTNPTATTVSSSQINLSWTASTDNVGVTGYKIYRCSGSACAPTTQIATSPTNSYSNTSLATSTAYTYAVSAYDAAGNNSAKSSSVSATTQSPTPQCSDSLDNDNDGKIDFGGANPDPDCSSLTDNNESDTTSPIISSVISTTLASTTARIDWTTNEPATSQVEYGFTTQYGASTTLDATLATSHSVLLSNLSPDNTTYNFRVRSKDSSNNESVSTNNTFITTGLTDIIPPASTTNLTANNITQTSVDLVTWTAAGDDGNNGTAFSFDIRYATGELSENTWNDASVVRATGEPTPKPAGSLMNYTLVGLTPNTTYKAALKTLDEILNQSFISNIITFTTLVAQSTPQTTTTTSSGGGGSSSGGGGGSFILSDTTPPPQITNLESQGADKQIRLTWKNPESSDYVRTIIVRKEWTSATTSSTSSLQILHATSTKDGTIIYEGTANEFTDTKLKNNQTYYYSIFTIDRTPNYSSPATTTVKTIEGKMTAEIEKKEPTSQLILRQATTTQPSTLSFTIKKGYFKRTLKQGMKGKDVKMLQKVLYQNKTEFYAQCALNPKSETLNSKSDAAKSKVLSFKLQVSGCSKEKLITSYFGKTTKLALIKFQEKYKEDILKPIGLTSGTGYFGKSTIKKIEALYGKKTEKKEIKKEVKRKRIIKRRR